jgi:hypothetical protein
MICCGMVIGSSVISKQNRAWAKVLESFPLRVHYYGDAPKNLALQIAFSCDTWRVSHKGGISGFNEFTFHSSGGHCGAVSKIYPLKGSLNIQTPSFSRYFPWMSDKHYSFAIMLGTIDADGIFRSLGLNDSIGIGMWSSPEWQEFRFGYNHFDRLEKGIDISIYSIPQVTIANSLSEFEYFISTTTEGFRFPRGITLGTIDKPRPKCVDAFMYAGCIEGFSSHRFLNQNEESLRSIQKKYLLVKGNPGANAKFYLFLKANETVVASEILNYPRAIELFRSVAQGN